MLMSLCTPRPFQWLLHLITEALADLQNCLEPTVLQQSAHSVCWVSICERVNNSTTLPIGSYIRTCHTIRYHTIALHYIIEHYTTLDYTTTLHYMPSHYISLHDITSHHITLHCLTNTYNTCNTCNTCTVQHSPTQHIT